jgi:hypothetical protein
MWSSSGKVIVTEIPPVAREPVPLVEVPPTTVFA